MGGFVYGFTGENNLTELQTCLDNDYASYLIVEKGIAAYYAGDEKASFEAIAELLHQLPVDLKSCYKSRTDVKAIYEWAQIFTDKAALVADVTKHYALHRKAITADIATFKADWAAAEYW